MTIHRTFYWIATALFLAINSIFVFIVWGAVAKFHSQEILRIYPFIEMGFPYPASTPSFDRSYFVVMVTSLLMIGMWIYEIQQHGDKCRRSFTFFVSCLALNQQGNLLITAHPTPKKQIIVWRLPE